MTNKSSSSKRLKKARKHQSFVLEKPLKLNPSNDLSLNQVIRQSLKLIKLHKWKFLSLSLIFMALGIIISYGLHQSIDLDSKFTSLEGSNIKTGFAYEIAKVIEQLEILIQSLLSYMMVNWAWFLVLILLISLSSLHLTRNLSSIKDSKKVKVLDAIYFGPAQIIPFILILFLLFLQFLPALIVFDFASQLRNDGVLDSNLDQLGAVVVVLIVTSFCLYWVMSGIFSLIIVSLNKTKPWQAWKLGFNLLQGRRSYLLKHVIFLIVAFFLFTSLICLPFIYLINVSTIYILISAIILALVVLHIYWFCLYEQLLKINYSLQDDS